MYPVINFALSKMLSASGGFGLRESDGTVLLTIQHDHGSETMPLEQFTGCSVQQFVTMHETAYKWQQVKRQRDQLLQECDWTQLNPNFLHQQQYQTYRQQLRDIPQDFSDPDAVIWPDKPNI